MAIYLATETLPAWDFVLGTIVPLATFVFAALIVAKNLAIATPSDRQRWGFHAIGTIASFLAYAIYYVPGVPFAVGQVVGFAVVLMPICIAYAVFRLRVLDVNFVLNRALVYGILSLVVIAFVSVLDWFLSRASRGRLAIGVELLATIAIGFLLDRINHAVERLVESVFFRRRRVSEKLLRRAATALPYATEESAIIDGLVQVPVNALELAAAALYRRSANGSRFEGVATSQHTTMAPPGFDANDLLVRLLLADESIVWLDELRTHLDPQNAAIYTLAVPVTVRHELVSFTLYGAHANGAQLDPDEVVLLEELAREAARALRSRRSGPHARTLRPTRRSARGRLMLRSILTVALFCATAAVGAAQTSTPTPTQAPTAFPSPLPLDPAVRAQIDGDVNAILRSRHATGATISIVEGDGSRYVHGYGLRDIARNLPAEANTHYEIGSITKQFTAAAIAQLVLAGKLKLDAPVSTYVPNAPHASEITVRQLVVQTSGLPEYLNGEGIVERGGKPATFEQLMALVAGKPLEFTPGTQWAYSNTNYIILGRVIEAVSKQPYEAYVREHLFAPAEMTQTTTMAGEVKVPGMALGYRKSDGQTLAAYPLDDSFAGAAGNIVSTADDLQRWNEALVSGKIVSPEGYTMMTTPGRLTSGAPTSYGFALIIDKLDGRPRIWHNGGTFGFAAIDWHFPEQKLWIIVLTNDEHDRQRRDGHRRPQRCRPGGRHPQEPATCSRQNDAVTTRP